MALGPGGTIHERTFSSLSSSPGEGLCFPAYNVQRGRPRSSGGRAWCPVKQSPLPGMDGCSRFGLVTGNECDTLSRDQAMTAAMRLHRDAYLMQTNLDILDQYALALHGTASKLLQKTIGGGPYPRAEVTAAAQGTRSRQSSVHMEALGLWRPSLDPVQFATSQAKDQHPGRLQ